MFQLSQPADPQELQEYYDLRWRVLRSPWDQPRGSERDELENVADHVIARDARGRLVGGGRLHLNNDREAQIRYMAVESNSRGMGIGRAIAEQLEHLARQHRVEKIGLNARTQVVGFYQRLGYRVVREGPTMFDQVTHVWMEKRLCG